MISKILFMVILVLKRIKQIVGISNALIRNKISFYPNYVEKFEKRYSTMMGTKYGLSFCNGTSAIEASLFAIGIKSGDEIIVPSCTFHASIDPIVNAGATPIFVDIQKKTLTICPKDLKRKINDETKAIIVVHLFGFPVDIQEIKNVAQNKKIAIIEDASHAHGASVKNRKCGSLGDIGVFSLQGSKAVAAGEGGIAITNNEKYFLRMSLWGHFDRHSKRFSRINAENYAYTGFGYKRRMAPVSVLIASADLDFLNWTNRIMKKTSEMLDHEMSILKTFSPVRLCNGGERGGYFGGYPILINSKEINSNDIIKYLKKQGIESLGYPFVQHHKLQIYNDNKKRVDAVAGIIDSADDYKKVNKLHITEKLPEKLFLLPRRQLILLSRRKIKSLVKILKKYEEETIQTMK